MTDIIIERIQQNPDKVFFPNVGGDNIFTKGISINRVFFRIPGTEIDIYKYGFLIAIGVLLACIYGFKKFKKFGIDPDRAIDAIIGGVIGAIIGARLYYVIFSWSNYYYNDKIHFKEIINIRDGGLAIYGGIIGALIVGGLVARWRKLKISPLFDLTAMGLLIGQALGRWGNFFNQEAFGSNTDLPWGMTSSKVIQYLNLNSTKIFNESGVVVDPFKTVHPCFLYESLWCILGFIALNIYMKHRKFDGEIFLMYTGWYGLGRLFIEGLRTDSLYVTGTHIRVSQLIAGACVVFAVIAIAVIRVKIKKKGNYQFFYETETSINQLKEYEKNNKRAKKEKVKKSKINIAESIENAFEDDKKDEENNNIEVNNEDKIDNIKENGDDNNG